MTFAEKIDEIYEIKNTKVKIEKFKELRNKAEWQGLIELTNGLDKLIDALESSAIEGLKDGYVTEEDIERMNSEYT